MICNEINCLESLVGIKGTCNENVDCPPFFIDDIEGVDMQSLADFASGINISGAAYAKQLINTAARVMMADIQGLVSGGYSLQDGLGELCSTCAFVATYQAAGGVKITRSISSQFAVLKITKVEVLVNATGDQVLVLDDGKDVKTFPFTALGAGVVAPLLIDYETKETSVKISLQDASLALGLIVCEKASGCGCSGGSAPVNNPVVFTGLVAGMASTNQYGFKVCANLSCSTDLLICAMINQTPNLFGYALLLRTGMQYYGSAQFSTRINKTVLRNGEEVSISMQEYFEGLYRERLAGSSKVKGLKEVISKYLFKIAKDKCVKCDSFVSVGYATG